MSTDPPKTNPELAAAYAALILADAEVPITAEKLQVLIKAAKIEDVEPIWTTLFAKALQGKDVKDLLVTVQASGAANTGGPSGPDGQREDGEQEGGNADEGVGLVESGDESDGPMLDLFDM